ncbi:TPA: hypothetical protein ACHDRY_001226 [Campylobacter jejuni]|nr:alpha-2,3-sialyltransferase [Campylobacter jejuni]
MSKEICDFMEKLKDWKNNFTIECYDYARYNCELAELVNLCNNADKYSELDIIKVRNFWSYKMSGEFFELQHPELNHITTRAVFNALLYKNTIWGNCVFMVDKDNNFPWLLIQMYHLNTCMITQNGIFTSYFTHREELGLINCFVQYFYESKHSYDLLQYRNVSFGISLNIPRPFHYFEHLSSFLFLFEKNKTLRVFDKSFFIPKEVIKSKSEKDVAIYSAIFGRMNCIQSRLFEQMINYIIKESFQDYYILVDKNKLNYKYDLIVWLGLPGERRAWIEQIEGFAKILKCLNIYFKKIKIYIDGITAYDGERQKSPDNEVLFNKVVNATRKLFLQEYGKNIIFTFEEFQNLMNISIKDEEKIIVFKSLAGYDYRTKICYCNDCDIAISDGGTTTTVPFIFLKKPGVIFCGNLSHIHLAYSILNNRRLQKVTNERMFIKKDRYSYPNFDYHMSFEYIYNLAAEVLEELSAAGKLKVKNLKMHRLDVPPVELIAKQYELEQKLNIKFSIENVALFSELEKKIDTLALNNTAIINNANNTTLLIQNKDQYIHNLEQNIQNLNHQILFKTAKARIQNHLSYKLGQALIINSKSILGYIRMPYVLSYIKDKHRQEQKAYEEKIKDNPNLALPPLETYPDYNEALKEKECFTYKLGEALIKADKEWYKAGYVKFYFKDVPRLKREFGKR